MLFRQRRSFNVLVPVQQLPRMLHAILVCSVLATSNPGTRELYTPESLRHGTSCCTSCTATPPAASSASTGDGKYSDSFQACRWPINAAAAAAAAVMNPRSRLLMCLERIEHVIVLVQRAEHRVQIEARELLDNWPELLVQPMSCLRSNPHAGGHCRSADQSKCGRCQCTTAQHISIREQPRSMQNASAAK